MRIVSVNVGAARPISTKSGLSGIFKEPVATAVQAGPLGLARDTIVDTRNHGGEDQAVYLFGVPDYDWWARELGRALPPGIFGENLTVSGLVSADMNIGDRLRTGRVLLEVTSPRIPCATLAARMGEPTFVKRFARAERFGVYCRVIEAGPLQAGDGLTLEPFEGVTVSALEVFRAFYAGTRDEAMLRRALEAPLHHRTRREYEALLRSD